MIISVWLFAIGIIGLFLNGWFGAFIPISIALVLTAVITHQDDISS